MKRLFTNEQERQIVEDYLMDGASMLTVAIKWDCAEATVRDILDRNNQPRKPRKPGIAASSRDVRIFRDYLDDKTVGFLSGKYQLSPSRICTILNSFQPDRRRKSWN